MPSPDTDSPAFELKSGVWSLTVLRLRTHQPQRLADALAAAAADSPGLFDREPVIVDLDLLEDGAALTDFNAVLDCLRAHGLQPVGVQGGSGAQREAAAASGLSLAFAPVARPTTAREAEPTSSDAGPPSDDAVGPAVPAASGNAPTLVVDTPLRSGQRVYARGGDLVVLSVVSFGAEVIADGHIHVYGPLRGRAIAGASGDAGARIYSLAMDPQLVSIAGIYRTTEVPLPDDVRGKAAQVLLEGEHIVVRPLRG